MENELSVIPTWILRQRLPPRFLEQLARIVCAWSQAITCETEPSMNWLHLHGIKTLGLMTTKINQARSLQPFSTSRKWSEVRAIVGAAQQLVLQCPVVCCPKTGCVQPRISNSKNLRSMLMSLQPRLRRRQAVVGHE
jgi:hypothetical protein